MKFGFAEVLADVNDVNAITVEAWDDQLVPALVTAAKATTAGVPVHMVHFVALVGHMEPIYHLENK